MGKNKGEKIYVLGSKLNEMESIILEKGETMGVVGFSTLESAKNSFKDSYDLLLVPQFTPSFPPSSKEMQYHTAFMKLISFYPIFVEIDKKNASEVLMEWRDKAHDVFQTEENFFMREYWHMPMRTGFFEKFGALDIVKDIETTPFVGPDGKMVHRVNRRTFGPVGNLANYQLSQKEIDEILRQRGYL